jgi:hypothetical protein
MRQFDISTILQRIITCMLSHGVSFSTACVLSGYRTKSVMKVLTPEQLKVVRIAERYAKESWREWL